MNLLNDFPEHNILYQFRSRVSNYSQTLPKGYRADCSRKRLCLYKKNKLKEYPTLTSKEVDEYIRLKSDDRSLLSLILERVYIENIICLFRTGSFPHSIKKKICKVANINQEILRVIEKPILETIL